MFWELYCFNFVDELNSRQSITKYFVCCLLYNNDINKFLEQRSEFYAGGYIKKALQCKKL